MTTLLTPDRRYIIVRGRLWRAANPHLAADVEAHWVGRLMDARRRVKAALRSTKADELACARCAVHEAKIALGERGPVWWSDGARDFNRCLVKNSPYAAWYNSLPSRPSGEG